MAVVTETSGLITSIIAGNLVDAHQFEGRVRIADESFTTNADDSATSIYNMLYLPTSARLVDGFLTVGAAFASAGTATMDVGIKHVDGTSFTADPDIILDGVDIETAAARYNFFTAGTGVASLINQQKPIWELMGASSDPGGFAVIYATLNTTLTTGDTFRTCALWTRD